MARWFHALRALRAVRSHRARPVVLGLECRVVPATFTVVNAADAGIGSLRQAILDANATGGADDIDFDPTFFNAANPRTITLTAASGHLTIARDLIVAGPGPDILTVSGGGAVRVFNVTNAAAGAINVTLSGMTVTGGNGTSNGATAADGGGISTADENLTLDNVVVNGNAAIGVNDGGGIGVSGVGFLTIRNSTISGNTSRQGGGIYFYSGGGLLMEDSTVSGNVAAGSRGGGIYFYRTVSAGGFTIRNSTIAGNTAAGSGGGIALPFLDTVNAPVVIQNCTITGNAANTGSLAPGDGGGGIAVKYSMGNPTLNIESSIISGNTAVNGRSDIAALATVNVTLDYSAVGDADGFAFTGGNNLPFGSVLNLLPLAMNGGPTETVALGPGSLAVDAGSNPAMLATDQRGPGFPREVGTAVDIGAFEGVLDAPYATGGPYANVTTPGDTTYTFDVTYSGATPIDVSTLDGDDIRATGPNGFSQLAAFVGVTPSGNGSPRTATYRITAPGGTFDPGDNGTYTIHLQAGQVANTTGGIASAATVATFSVRVAQTYTVTNLNNAGAGSLRQAILDSNASVGLPDTIVFEPGLTGTIILNAGTGQLAITDSVTIVGPGADAMTVSGIGAVRVFDIDGPGVLDVSISGLTVIQGNGRTGGPTPVSGFGGGIRTTDERVTLDGVVVSGNLVSGFNRGGGIAATGAAFLTIRNSTVSGNNAPNGSGGGIFFDNGGGLLLENSTISGNFARDAAGGGGIYFDGLVAAGGFTIRNSTIANNVVNDTTTGSGGGILFKQLNTTNAPVVIQNSTITGNSVAGLTSSYFPFALGGGGIAIQSVGVGPSVLTLESTIVSGNTSANGNDDIAARSVSTVTAAFSAIGDADGFTLTGAPGLPFGTDLGLETLADNGGPTRTISFAADSPLINAGANPANLPTDQRGPGFARASGGGVDIGAFERQAAPTVAVVIVNGGQANTEQRSRVTSIDVRFDTVVEFAGAVEDAFTLSRITGGAIGGFTATADVVNGVTVVTLTNFTGAETEFGSLADGRYSVLVRADMVSAGGQQLDGDGDGAGGDDYTLDGTTANGLFRIFGDSNGDGTTNAADFGQFRNAFGSSVGQTAYLEFLDFDASGSVNAFDFAQFRQRFGAGVP